MGMLWKYAINDALTVKNAGYSMWGFGTRNNEAFFIKQFLSPKYPANDTQASQELIAKRINKCKEFVARKRTVYEALNQNSDGNDVRVVDFFRVGSRYYIAMEKIDALPWTVDTVAALDVSETRRLCMVIAHAVACLHKGLLVHADLKHDNILFSKTKGGYVTAKIIDFDSSFLESAPPEDGEDIAGDFVYFSPEACLKNRGDEAVLTCKMDIFALGVLFHQYFSGVLPQFDRTVCSYPCEAALMDVEMKLSEDVPAEYASLIRAMLDVDPAKRPTAQEVYEALRPPEMTTKEETPEKVEVPGASQRDTYFYKPPDI